MIPVAKWRPWRSLLGACFACKEIFISHCSHTGPKYLLYAHRDQIVRATLECGRNSEFIQTIDLGEDYFVVVYKPRRHFCPPPLPCPRYIQGAATVCPPPYNILLPHPVGEVVEIFPNSVHVTYTVPKNGTPLQRYPLRNEKVGSFCKKTSLS